MQSRYLLSTLLLVCSAATLLYYRRAALGRQRLVEDN